MTDRIKQILEHKKLTASQFSNMIGVQPSSLSHILSGRNKPSLDFIQKILKTFPEIDADWLLFGEKSKSSHSDSTLFDYDDFTDVNNNNIDKSKKVKPDKTLKSVTDVNYSSMSEKIENSEVGNEVNKKAGIKNDKGESFSSKVRKARKVIILYNDESFEEYSPSGDQ